MDYDKRTWTEFMDSGMLWFVNRILHVFGWVIIVEVDTIDTVGGITKAWPARTKVLGFPSECDEEAREKFLRHVREKGFGG